MFKIKQTSRRSILVALLAALAACGLIGQANRLQLIARSGPQLVAIQPLPELSGEMCPPLQMASLQAPSAPLRAVSTKSDNVRTQDSDRSPVRVIRDTYPTYSAIGVDTNSNEIFLQDENLF